MKQKFHIPQNPTNLQLIKRTIAKHRRSKKIPVHKKSPKLGLKEIEEAEVTKKMIGQSREGSSFEVLITPPLATPRAYSSFIDCQNTQNRAINTSGEISLPSISPFKGFLNIPEENTCADRVYKRRLAKLLKSQNMDRSPNFTHRGVIEPEGEENLPPIKLTFFPKSLSLFSTEFRPIEQSSYAEDEKIKNSSSVKDLSRKNYIKKLSLDSLSTEETIKWKFKASTLKAIKRLEKMARGEENIKNCSLPPQLE